MVEARYGIEPTREIVEKIKAEMGIDRPFFIQYIDWLSKAVRRDFGVSWTEGEPVMDVILERLPISAELFFRNIRSIRCLRSNLGHNLGSAQR